MATVVNYSTRIAATKTVAEMQTLLAAHGVYRVAVDYAQGVPKALTFVLPTVHGDRGFRLPADAGAMQQLLIAEDGAGRLKSGSRDERVSRTQAERVAWRVMKDWLAAQLTLAATAMVDMDELFLPYMLTGSSSDGPTVYQQYVESQRLPAELEAGVDRD